MDGCCTNFKMTQRPKNHYKAYHAHVYFDAQTLNYAANLCQQAGQELGLKVGRVHEKLVGPHPCWSCQLLFNRAQFDTVIPWLEKNRQNLSILIHGLTGDDLADHTENASWLGDPVELNLAFFEQLKTGTT